MKEPRISVEHHARVYDDDHGWHVEVGPDGDGLDLCRIAYIEDGAPREIIIPWPHAEAVANAIFDLAPRAKPKALAQESGE
jgi:hypothetical protein